MNSDSARRRRKLNASKHKAVFTSGVPIPTEARVNRKKELLLDVERELGFYPSDLKPLTVFALKDFLENLQKRRRRK